jgi:predicted DNA-binding transcriptional regulator AlpA
MSEPQEPLISERRLAEWLGISYASAKRRRAEGADWPPHRKIGRLIRYSTAEVKAWLEGRHR